MGRGRRVRLVLLALLVAVTMVGGPVAWPGLAMPAAAQTLATPTITTTPSAGGPVGTSISDTATVSATPAPTPAPTPPTTFPSEPGLPDTGALSADPTGTVTFQLFPPSDPTCAATPVFTSTNPLSAGTAISGSFPTNAPGTWNWVAIYSGDADNSSVSTACGDEPVTITGPPAPALNTTKTLSTVDGVAPAPPAFDVKAGAELVYTIAVANTGGAGGTTDLTDPVPAGTTYTGTGEGWDCPTPTAAGTDCTQSVTVAPGATTTLTYTVTVDNPLPAALGLTTIDNLVSSSTGTCSSCSTSNPLMDRIYWTNPTTGTLLVANLDGTHPAPLVTGQIGPEGLTVANGHLYWTNTNGFAAGTGLIMEANLDGTGVTTLVTGQNIPFGITVTSSHIYWSNFGGALNNGSIMVSNLDGSSPTTLVTAADCPATFPTCVDGPQQVAVTGTHIYWASTSVGSTRPSAVMAANLDGSGVTPVVQSSVSWPIQPPPTSTGRPTGIAVLNGQLYWTLYDYGEVWLSNLDGSSPATIVTGQTTPDYMAVDPTIDSSHIYWTNQQGGTIMRANLDGSSPTVVINGVGTPTGLALGPP